MTSVAVIPAQSAMLDGLWSGARSEGRVPLNWAALLAANGYDVRIPAPTPHNDPCAIPGVRFMSVDEIEDVDFVLFGTTSTNYGWMGLGTVRPRHVIRLQWPTGFDLTRNGEILAAAHPALAEQVHREGKSPCFVLRSPVLPLSWWCANGQPNRLLTQIQATLDDPAPRRTVLWAAREAFGGENRTSDTWGDPFLSALEQLLPARGLDLVLLNRDDYRPEHGPFLQEYGVWDRLLALGATMEGAIHLGSVLMHMHLAKVAITLSPAIGPTIPEAIFAGAAPLVWDRYEPVYPELTQAARRHDLLMHFDEQPTKARSVLTRLLDDEGLRQSYLEDCRGAFSENTPERAMASWRAMEARI